MTKASIGLQELRRKIYLKAKADKAWRFWGLYVHVCKLETLREAYRLAKANNGAPGIDGVTFDAIEANGREQFLASIQAELESGAYLPMRNRRQLIPKSNGKFRTLGIPTIRDRVVQGALKLILEAVFEADFQDGSFGYRPKRTAHQAVHRVANAIAARKTRVIDLDIASYFDTVRHDRLLAKVAARVRDREILRLLKLTLKASGRCGVPQGGVISPLLSNLYLNEVDRMLERAKEVTRKGRYTHVEYARFADDLVVLVDGHPKWRNLEHMVLMRLRQEFDRLGLTLNEEKCRTVDLEGKGDFDFLGFNIRQRRTRSGKLGARLLPRKKARQALFDRVKEVFGALRSKPTQWVINAINPILRGWTNYFRIGQVGKYFSRVRHWVELKLRRHLMRSRARRGFGWKRWSSAYLYECLKLFGDYQVRYYNGESAPSR